MPRERYYKNLFLVGALWNWGATGLFFVAWAPLFSLVGLAPPASPVFLKLFLALAFVFGIGYFWVSQDLAGNPAVVQMGILGKVAVFVLMAYYWLIGHIPFVLAMTGVVDLIFAILFIEFLFTRKRASFQG
ncbi:MAG: hypothetical protein JEZ11_16940 [Desulfobacterales bacterium]|nr:hypothetical protein [Desulfobacterales bacterium]